MLFLSVWIVSATINSSTFSTMLDLSEVKADPTSTSVVYNVNGIEKSGYTKIAAVVSLSYSAGSPQL